VKLPRFGFIGVGTMNSAIVQGLCRYEGAPMVKFPVKISVRNALKSASLLEEFGPELIKVCENEEIAESVDVLVIGLTPGVCME